jgi:hypothetical protein
MGTKIYDADLARHDSEAELNKIVEKATKRIDERLSRKKNSLGYPGYIVVDVGRAVSPLFGNTPRELKEIARERVILDYRGAGWNTEHYTGEYSFSRDSLSGLIYEVYLDGKYKFSLPQRVK